MKYTDLGKQISQHQQQRRLNSKRVSLDADSKKSGSTKFVVITVILLLVVVIGVVFSDGVKALFDPVSIVSNAATSGLNETDGRINVLVLGSDRRLDDYRETNLNSNELTDTILVASIGVVEGNIVLLSLPRDLWVEAQTSSGQTYHSKINAVYAYSGAEGLSDVVEEVIGLPIHYYAVINFEIFKEAIDIIGGVEVKVENAFTDYYYPVAGKEAASENERYETVHFEEGPQVMDGEVALKYVRSRKGNNGEGTDFARSRRQQKVIAAIKEKALSLETLISVDKMIELYTSYKDNVDTNVGLNEANGFYFLAQNIDFQNMKSIVLDDRSAADEGGLLYAPEDRSLYDNAYVLIPKSGNFNQLHAYVQRYVFGAE